MPPGGNCGAGKPYYTRFILGCDKQIAGLQINSNQVFDTTRCNNTIRMTSAHACAFGEFYSWWNYLPLNKWIIGALLFLLGIYFCIFGQKHFNITAGILIGGVSGYILHGFFRPIFPIFALWRNLYILFLDYLIVGVLLGVLVVFVEKVISILLGIISGYLLGNLLFNVTVPLFGIEPVVLFYICIAACVVPLCFFAWKIQKYLVIIVTSFIGGYISVRVI